MKTRRWNCVTILLFSAVSVTGDANRLTKDAEGRLGPPLRRTRGLDQIVTPSRTKQVLP